MLRLPLVLVMLTVAAVPGSSQEPQATHTGRIEPGFINTYAFTPAAPGQLLATLAWDSNAAHLLLILVCSVEGEELPFGVASGMLDRFARLEAGVLPVACEIGVMTASASANYTLNLQRSVSEPSNPQAPESMTMGRTGVRRVIPGTSRGSVIERMAFRLERAARP